MSTGETPPVHPGTAPAPAREEPEHTPDPRRWRRRALKLVKVVGTLGVVAAVLGCLPARQVIDPGMTPSVAPGDWVWVLPLEVRRGDVVRLQDPLDPDVTVLRRVIAGAGQKVRYEDGGVRVNGKRVRQKEMGRVEQERVLKETIWSKPPAVATTWLVQRDLEPVHWSMEPVEIPEDHWFVLADDRDQALDSRWWGPIPASAITGVVRLRFGEPTTWRPRLDWLQGTE